MTGKIAGTELGYLNMSTNQKNDIPETDFNVFRLKKPILKRSNIGAMIIDRSSISDSTDHRSIGFDANFNEKYVNIAIFFRNLKRSRNFLPTFCWNFEI
mgnify:CR=1 FL=1